jgi:hypothetical protein
MQQPAEKTQGSSLGTNNPLGPIHADPYSPATISYEPNS